MFGSAATTRQPAAGATFRAPRPTLRLDPLSPAEVDASLVRLARVEARSRFALGRAAARFLVIRGHDRLGFRLGDYARERLGISGRELSSFAFVASRLAERPRLAAAFARGELSWSKTRLLCAVASAETEALWVERARVATVDELVAAVRGERHGMAAHEIGDAIDEESDATEGEPRVRFAVRCPARVLVLWRRAIETARRMLGSQAPVWQAAEAIAAEVASLAPDLVEAPAWEGADVAPVGPGAIAALPSIAARETFAEIPDEDDGDPAGRSR